MHKPELFDSLRGRLIIDKVQLDREYIEQPSLLMDAVEAAAEAGALADRAKAGLDIAKSVGAVGLRDLLLNGKQRSEAAITSELNTIPDVIDAKEILIEADKSHQMWNGMVEAIKSRGFTLRGLTDMTLSAYTSSNSGGEQPKRRPIEEVQAHRRSRRNVVE